MTTLIIDFSSIGGGEGNQVDLCSDCRYHLKIQRRDRVPQVMWLSGTEVTQFRQLDVKIIIRGIKRCARHSPHHPKSKPAFIEAALRSGIDINPAVDDYRNNILKMRPHARTS